jgi:UTP--glucose-1-phosphate uridylyltransferase
MKKPTKAIICAAGMGTRFLPQTKAMPKEMLPIVDKPVIQHIIEQIVQAGVTDIIIVTGSNKRNIEDHFDRNIELENKLRETGKSEMADQIKSIANLANFVYVRQKGDCYGSACPIIDTMHLIDDDEPFFVFFPDDYFRSDVSYPVQLLKAHEKTGKSVISLVEVDRKDADKYGMVNVGDEVSERVYRLNDLVEKPGEKNTPSNLASAGSFLLTPDILPLVARKKVGKNGEVMLVDSIIDLMRSDEVYGCSIEGIWHDTGDQLKYLKAVVDEALVSEKYGEEFEKYLRTRLES